MAWKLFDYDRSVIYCCSENKECGFLQPEGIKTELKYMEEYYYASDKFPILTAITHCLQVGDIITRDRSGNYDIIEIKSGNSRGKRMRRQETRMRDLVSLLNDRKLIKDKINKNIVIIDNYPNNYFKQISTALEKSYEKGIEVIELNDFTFVDIINHDRFMSESQFDKSINKAHDPYIKKWGRQHIMISSFDRLNYNRIIAPLTLFPFSERICSDLMFGVTAIYLHFNFVLFENFLISKGCNIIESAFNPNLKGNTGASTYIYKLGFKDMIINISASSLMRILFEFSHPKLIIKEIEKIYSKRELGTTNILVLNPSEKMIWK